jgi:hypothetical protein
VLDKALELVHQVHQLRIYLEYVDLVNTLNEEVRLHSLWNDRSLMLEGSGHDCHISISLPDKAKASSLQVLHLYGVSIGQVPRDRGPSQPTTLTFRSTKQDCAKLWDMLHYATQTEILWLEHTLPEKNWSLEMETHLPSLRLLNISDAMSSLTEFLNYLQPTVGMRLHLHVLDASHMHTGFHV